MAGLQLGGLASGLDTDSIVAQLMAIERQPQTKLQLKQRQVQARQGALRDVSTRLRNLKTAADDLKSVSTWLPSQTADTSDAGRATVRRLGNAGPGGYSLDVSRLARAEQRTFTYTTNAGANTTIDVDGVSVAVAAGSTIQQAADAINAQTGIGAFATVVGDATAGTQRLVLSHRTTGDTRLIAAGSTISEVAGTEILGQDARYSTDGGTTWKLNSTNVLTSAIAGLEVTLKGVTPTGAPVTINVGPLEADRDAIKGKVKAFVDQYNSTLDFVNGKLNEKPIKQADAKTDADLVAGVLYGDNQLRSLLDQLRGTLLQGVASNPGTLDQLSEIGVSTGGGNGGTGVNQEAVSGRLTLNETTFMSALTTDPTSVKNLLGAGTDAGLTQRFDAILEPNTQSGGNLDLRVGSADRDLSTIKDDLAALDKRLATKEKLLKAQFQRMEQALMKSQSQGQWLSGQLAGLR